MKKRILPVVLSILLSLLQLQPVSAVELFSSSDDIRLIHHGLTDDKEQPAQTLTDAPPGAGEDSTYPEDNNTPDPEDITDGAPAGEGDASQPGEDNGIPPQELAGDKSGEEGDTSQPGDDAANPPEESAGDDPGPGNDTPKPGDENELPPDEFSDDTPGPGNPGMEEVPEEPNVVYTYELWPRSINGDLNVGETLEIRPELRRLVSGQKGFTVVTEGVVFRIEIDEEDESWRAMEDDEETHLEVDDGNGSGDDDGFEDEEVFADDDGSEDEEAFADDEDSEDDDDFGDDDESEDDDGFEDAEEDDGYESYENETLEIVDNADGTFTLTRLNTQEASFTISAFISREGETPVAVDTVRYILNDISSTYTLSVNQNTSICLKPGDTLSLDGVLEACTITFTRMSRLAPAGEAEAPESLAFDDGKDNGGIFDVSEDTLTILKDALGDREALTVPVRILCTTEDGYTDAGQITILVHKHTCEEWNITRKATISVKGKKTGTCLYCGQPMTAVIKKVKPFITLNKPFGKLAKTKSGTINVAYGNGDAIEKLTTSDKAIATAKANGRKITITAGKKAGKATITVKLISGLSAAFTLTVPKVACTAIKAKSTYTVTTKSIIDLGVTLKPVLSDNALTYTSADKKIAIVNRKGQVKGVRTGKTTITIKTDNNITKKVTINVKQGTTAVNTDKNKYTVKKGKTVAIKTTLSPETSADGISYTSANEKIATVSSKGTVKGLKKGKTTITVTSGTITKEVTVTVQ